MAKSEFVVSGYIAHADIDNFANGCQIEGGKTEFGQQSEHTYRSDTLTGLIAILCKEFKADEKAVALNCCDELGRLDIQVNQREAFVCATPSANTLASWRNGEIDLWLTNYTFTVNRVVTEMDLQLCFDTEKAMSERKEN